MSIGKGKELIRGCCRQLWATYDIAWTAFDVLVVGPAMTLPRSLEELRRGQITAPSEPELALLGGFDSAQQIAGRAAGAHNLPAFSPALRLTADWGFSLAGLASVLALGGRQQLVGVRDVMRRRFCIFLFAAPSGLLVFQMGGIFLGPNWSRDMRGGMLLSLAILVAAWFASGQMFGKAWALARLSHVFARAGGDRPAVNHARPCSHRLRGMIVDWLTLQPRLTARAQLLGPSVKKAEWLMLHRSEHSHAA